MAKKPSRRNQFIALALSIAGLLCVLFYMISDNLFAVLEARGVIAQQQKDLLIFATLLMLLIIVPVFFMTFYFAYKYREGNKKSRYTPNWDTNKQIEFAWWAVPFVIIFILSVVAFRTSHSLDPYKPINAEIKPINVQVVALQWKWLFIYPEQNLATVNYLQLPKDTPIIFSITSDAPMNSFWIPQLGGQIYAMPGMSTKLNLMANEVGTYRGSSANISGEGFAKMAFEVNVGSEVDFYQWVAKSKTLKQNLSMSTYRQIALPSSDGPELTYSSVDKQLYDMVLMKYMMPDHDGMKGHSS